MQIGIDFGTSYSAAAAYVQGELQGIRFGTQAQFRTAVFFPAAVPDPADFVLTDALQAEVDAYVRSARAAQRSAHVDWQRRQAEMARASNGDRARGQAAEPTQRSDAELHAAAIRQASAFASAVVRVTMTPPGAVAPAPASRRGCGRAAR